MDEGWLRAISTVGFPIVVSAYLLIRLEHTIKELTATVTKLTIVLARKGIVLNGEDSK
jgi:YvrJ protein family